MTLHPVALLFDMDGVLVNSLESWWHALDASLRAYGQPGVTREEFIQRFWGYDLNVNLRRHGLSAEIGTFCNHAFSRYVDCTTLFPETRPTLERLKKYHKAVITNSPRPCVDDILSRFQLSEFFEVVVTSDEVAKGKPDPELVFAACKQLRVSPRDVILIGDTVNDVLAGHAAGCHVIGLNMKADVTIRSLAELPSLL